MPRTLNLYEAKTNLSSLVDEAAAGEEMVGGAVRPRRPAAVRVSRSAASAGRRV
jgi:hypothetical protein